MAFKRRRTSSCCVVCQCQKCNMRISALKKRALAVSHLELVDEHSNRVQLVALVLALHDVFNSRVVVRPVKERMAVVQDSRRWSCSHSLCGREATLRGVVTMRSEDEWVSVARNLLSCVSRRKVIQWMVGGAAGIG